MARRRTTARSNGACDSKVWQSTRDGGPLNRLWSGSNGERIGDVNCSERLRGRRWRCKSMWRERVWLPKTYTDPKPRMENFSGVIFSSVLTRIGISDLRPARLSGGQQQAVPTGSPKTMFSNYLSARKLLINSSRRTSNACSRRYPRFLPGQLDPVAPAGLASVPIACRRDTLPLACRLVTSSPKMLAGEKLRLPHARKLIRGACGATMDSCFPSTQNAVRQHSVLRLS